MILLCEPQIGDMPSIVVSYKTSASGEIITCSLYFLFRLINKDVYNHIYHV